MQLSMRRSIDGQASVTARTWVKLLCTTALQRVDGFASGLKLSTAPNALRAEFAEAARATQVDGREFAGSQRDIY